MKRGINKNIETILNDGKLLPLSRFKSNRLYIHNLFPEAKQLPEFFSHNLQNSSRIVKQLSGSIGILRIFYYQLLKLSFEIQCPTQDYSSLIKQIFFNDEIIENNYSPISGKQYSTLQYLRIIAEMILELEKQVIPNIQMTISTYPIIDQALLSLLELIIEKQCEKQYNENLVKNNEKVFTISELLTKLCNVFEVNYETYGDCYSFEQADVFMYAETVDKVYLAYLSQMAEIDQASRTSETHTISKQNQNDELNDSDHDRQNNNRIRLSAGNAPNRTKLSSHEGITSPKIRNSTGSKPQSQIAVVPKNVFDSSSESQQLKNNSQVSQASEHPPKSYFQFDANMKYAQSQLLQSQEYFPSEKISEKNSEYKYSGHQRVGPQSKRYPEYYGYQPEITSKQQNLFQRNVQIQEPKTMFEKLSAKSYKKNERLQSQGLRQQIKAKLDGKSMKQLHRPSLYDRFLQNNMKTASISPQEQEIRLYTPNKVHSKLISPRKLNLKYPTLGEQAKNMNIISVNNLKQHKKSEKDDTLGTFYRQFTDTRVMEAMIEPYKTKVRNTRKHFKGIRSKNFMGLPFLN